MTDLRPLVLMLMRANDTPDCQQSERFLHIGNEIDTQGVACGNLRATDGGHLTG
jgi:hypothetical protein